jgi:hypothetical protein
MARGFGTRAPTLAALQLRRAAKLAAIAELAADDPTVSANDLVRLVGAADRARMIVEAMKPKPGPTDTRPLRERMASEGAQGQQ